MTNHHLTKSVLREEIASTVQEELRSSGCTACRVWVAGPENVEIHILDPDLKTHSHDYDGSPFFWYSVGAKRVVYYEAAGVVYREHKR